MTYIHGHYVCEAFVCWMNGMPQEDCCQGETCFNKGE